jgi:hypothetical protein
MLAAVSPARVRIVAVVLVALLGLSAALLLEGAQPPTVATAPSAAGPLVLEPLTAAGPIVALPGAQVSVPLAATQPRPILIVLHGAGESAERQCKIWRGISDARPFVLCPELGAKRTNEEVETGLRGALRELKAQFGEYVAGGSVVLVGFGPSAEHAVAIARQEPAFFARLALVDGGHGSWSATAAGAFAQRGGQRVLFGCSNEPCRAEIEPKLPVIRSQNLAIQLAFGGELPGPLDPRMIELLHQRFAWLISNEQPKRVPNPRGVVPE